MHKSSADHMAGLLASLSHINLRTTDFLLPTFELQNFRMVNFWMVYFRISKLSNFENFRTVNLLMVKLSPQEKARHGWEQKLHLVRQAVWLTSISLRLLSSAHVQTPNFRTLFTVPSVASPCQFSPSSGGSICRKPLRSSPSWSAFLNWSFLAGASWSELLGWSFLVEASWLKLLSRPFLQVVSRSFSTGAS